MLSDTGQRIMSEDNANAYKSDMQEKNAVDIEVCQPGREDET